MSDLRKEQFLAIASKLREVNIPELGGSVHIRPITLAEQARLADLGSKYEKAGAVERMKNITLRLVQWAVTDEEGRPMFEPKDIEELQNKPASIFLRLQEAILSFSGLTEESRKELEKNSWSDPSAETASALRGSSGGRWRNSSRR